MTAIRSAIHAIEAEIATSKARLIQLESALKSLKPFHEQVEPAPKAKKEAAVAEAAVDSTSPVDVEAETEAVGAAETDAPTKKKRGRKPGAPAATFPKTGSEFFYSVLGNQRKTMNDLVEGAARKLGVEDQAGMKILRARITSWLYPAIKAGHIGDAGVKNDLKAYKLTA
jgi:hypothetical protein